MWLSSAFLPWGTCYSSLLSTGTMLLDSQTDLWQLFAREHWVHCEDARVPLVGVPRTVYRWEVGGHFGNIFWDDWPIDTISSFQLTLLYTQVALVNDL